MVPKKRMDPWEIKPASIAVVAGAVDDVGKVGGKSGSTEDSVKEA